MTMATAAATTTTSAARTTADATPVAANEPPLEVRGLRKRYGSLVAVNDLSLRIERGSVVGFLGLNGAGKTTAMRMMCGLIRPDGGSVRIAGHDLRANPAAATTRIGYVADRCLVHGWMRVREAVDFHRRLRPRWDDALARELQELFALDPARRVKALSKGMKAKLSLLLAIAHRPDVLLLDEPLDGLDLLVREEFLDGLLRQVIDEQQTILFSTHGLADVDRIADSVAILHQGRLLAHRPLAELIATTRRIRIAGDAAVAPASLGDVHVLSGPVRERHDWTVVVQGDAEAMDRAVRAVQSVRPGAAIAIEPMSLGEIFRAYVHQPRARAATETTS